MVAVTPKRFQSTIIHITQKNSTHIPNYIKQFKQ